MVDRFSEVLSLLQHLSLLLLKQSFDFLPHTLGLVFDVDNYSWPADVKVALYSQRHKLGFALLDKILRLRMTTATSLT